MEVLKEGRKEDSEVLKEGRKIQKFLRKGGILEFLRKEGRFRKKEEGRKIVKFFRKEGRFGSSTSWT